MNDRQRQQLVEQCEEAELTLLMYDYAREEGRQLAKEYDEAQENGTLPEVPEELDRKCRALIDGTFAKMERKTRLKRIVRSAARAAAVLFVVLGVMATTVMSVDALRVPVVNFLFDHSDRFSAMSFGETQKNGSLYGKSAETVLESIIPADYKITFSEIQEDDTGMIIYESKEGFVISYMSYMSNGEMSIDTENITLRDVNLLGNKAWLIEKDGYKLVWTKSGSDLTHILYANGLSYEDFWMICCSIAEHE